MIGKALACALVSAAVAAPVALADGPQPLPGSLGGFACRQASSPLNRAIEVSATMRSLPGTQRMALRFQLLERGPEGRFHLVRGGDLGRWSHPNPPTFGQQPGDTWVVNKPVVNLDAPATYRFRVTFRWVGSDGVINTAVRLSTPCAQAG